MTEAIKQWIAERAAESFLFENTASYVETYINALTKGIEIAEGFSEWASMWYTWCGKDQWDGDNDEFFTTSQLLEIYLKTLEP